MKRLIVSALAAALAVSALAQGTLRQATPESHGMDSEKLAQVDRVINDAIAAKEIPGAVLSVVRGNDIVYLKAYGNKSVVPTVEPMTTETLFDLASVSKCVGTTLAFMQLIENGYVRLTDNVDRYIPNFKPWKDPESGETVDITIRDLLSHSSGLTPYINADTFVKEYGGNDPEKMEQYIATEIKRNFRPGTDFMYSCLNFVTLQRILERVTGEKLYEYAQKHVFDVLGLTHTCYFPLIYTPAVSNSAELAGLCAPTEVQADGKPLVAQVHDPMARRIMGGNSGNAGVFSNAEDLSVICSAIMNGGVLVDKKGNSLESTRILSPATVRLMTTIPSQNDPSVGRALGWDKKSSHSGLRGDLFNPETTIMHTGYTGTSIVIDTETKTAIILLTHRVHPEDKGSVGRLRALVANIVAGSIR
uniref:serine hydrolase domain-containing protein n=1 Tax=Candidatus Cryptobacteroides bacterium TaxID=3085639 RepID=UPI004029E194